MSIIKDKNKTFEYSVPVLIIGAGAAGMTAGLAAKDNGADVLILEQDSEPRGSTSMSQGNIAAAGTQSQLDHGIDDSGEIFAEDIIKITKGETDHKLAYKFAMESGPTIEWLINKHNIPLELDPDWGAKLGHSKPRIHSTPTKTGVELMSCLQNACEKSNIDILTNSKATSVFTNDKSFITGVQYQRPDGSIEEVGCNNLILATCGFGGNKEMIGKYIPEMSNALYHGHEGNDGAGIKWGIELGAGIGDMTAFQGLGALADPTRVLIHYNVILQGGIIVNNKGERFTNETNDISGMGRKVSAQPSSYVWFIFDELRNNFAMKYEEHIQANSLGAIQTANSIDELARITKTPASNLNQTLSQVIKMQKGLGTDSFGREFNKDNPLQGPPWFAVRSVGALFHTQGGLLINEKAQVTRKDNSVLPNLFAAGGTARSISGPSDWGYIPAAGLFTAVTQGRLAGINAATNKKV